MALPTTDSSSSDQEALERERRLELARFLRDRRARIDPADLGLATSSRRRARGLLREEVALQCGISTTWYTWLEQARDVRPSPEVVGRLASVLRLDADERAYLERLATPHLGGPSRSIDRRVPDTLRALVDGWSTNPAYLINARWDILYWNDAASALFGDFSTIAVDERNVLRLLFCNSSWRQLFVSWDLVAASAVAQFRSTSLDLATDPETAAMIARLRKESPTFALLWARQDVKGGVLWRKEVEHPRAKGPLLFDYASLRPDAAADIRLIVYAAADGASARRFQALVRGRAGRRVSRSSARGS